MVVLHNKVDHVTTIHNKLMWYLNTRRGEFSDLLDNKNSQSDKIFKEI